MTHEGDRRRRLILAAIAKAPAYARLFVARTAGRSQRAARDDCLRVLIPELTEVGTTRVVLESCDQDKRDRRVIMEALAKQDPGTVLSYHHLPPNGEPILWAADAVAWAWGRGADWRRRTDAILSGVRRCDT